MMRYTVISDDNFDDFVRTVNERISEGWRLQGGVSICVTQYHEDGYTIFEYTYAQAMTKP